MRVINSLADAENCADALANVFYEALMEELIQKIHPILINSESSYHRHHYPQYQSMRQERSQWRCDIQCHRSSSNSNQERGR